MSDLISLFKTRRDLVNLLVLVVIMIALPVGIGLVKQQQVLFSRAQVGYIKFKEGTCATNRNNQLIATCSDPITVEAVSPIGPPGTPTPNPSVIPTATPGGSGISTPTLTPTPMPPVTGLILEAESMIGDGTVFQDANAGGGAARRFNKDGNAQGRVNGGGSTIVIRAQAVTCASSKSKNTPEIQLKVDGKTVSTQSINSVSWTDFTVQSTLSSTNHEIRLSANNIDKKCSTGGLDVDKITILGGDVSSTPSPAPSDKNKKDKTKDKKSGAIFDSLIDKVYAQECQADSDCQDLPQYCEGGVTRQCIGGYCDGSGACQRSCDVVDGDPLNCGGGEGGGNCNPAPGAYHVCGDESTAQSACGNTDPTHQYRIYKNNACNWESCRDEGVNSACGGGGQCQNDGDSYTECSGNPNTYCYSKGGNYSQLGYVIDVQKKTEGCNVPYECSNPRHIDGVCGYSGGGNGDCSPAVGTYHVCGNEFAAKQICSDPLPNHQYRVYRSNSGGTCHWEQGSCRDEGVNSACGAGGSASPTPTPTAPGSGGSGPGGPGDSGSGGKNKAKCTLAFDPTPLPVGKTGAQYNAVVKLSDCEGISGVLPAVNTNLSVTSGSLPPGIALDDSLDSIKGTPTQEGTYSFTITAAKGSKKDKNKDQKIKALSTINGSIVITKNDGGGGGGGGQNEEKTAFFKFAETPEGLANAAAIPYTDEPVLINTKFSNNTPGEKFIFFEFIGTKGTVQRKSASIKLIGPDPQITSKTCSTSLGEDGVKFHLAGQHFGETGKLLISDTFETQINQWTDTAIDALFKFSLGNLRSTTSFPLKLVRNDGVETETVCTIGELEQLELGTKLFCRRPSSHTQENVEITIVQKPEPGSDTVGSNPVRETVSIDQSGKVTGLKTRFEPGKTYTVWVKAPRSLRKSFTFTVAEGTNVIPDMVLPVGDIFPLGDGDGVINAADKAQLNREWGESTSSDFRNGDFNRDRRVNSFDWACMRYDFGQRDESEP